MERFIRYAGLERVASDDECVAYLITTGRRLLADEIASQSPTIPVGEVKGASEGDNEAIEELIDIEAVLEQLEADEKSLMTLHLAGLSISEMAAKLDISYAAAGQRLSRTREKMKNLVKKSVKDRFIGQRKARK
jgi:RNA polymerase sigma factor (sigma-70 family)